MKRGIDLIISFVGIILFSPIFILTAIIIRTNLGSPIFHCQLRPGRKGKPFIFYKFRSMKNLIDKDGIILPDEARLTPFGKFIRQLSIDELPQLFNVLIGNMSIVGPRPLLMEYLSLYTPYQARRHEMLPGITGWAQVHGRNATTWEERLAQDVWYVDHQSLLLDFYIILRTLRLLLKREGVNAPGHSTMPKFTGNVQR